MEAETLRTPVALFVFNRPETTRKVFEAIAVARPAKLLLIADGPRPERSREAAACLEVRSIVSRVDWPCEVLTNFAAHNLGCQERIISGIDWAFSLVEDAIFLEDDCLPDPSFFPFCQELLEMYRGDSRIAAISGTNLVEKSLNIEASYFFSQLGGNWGWATWKSQWQRYDRYLKDWPDLKRNAILAEVFDRPETVAYWTSVFDDMYLNNGRNAWDYQWLYTHLRDNTLTIIPRVNLVQNIGFGQGATHTGDADVLLTPPTSPIRFPLRHPSNFIPLRSMDRHFQDTFSLRLSQRVLRRVQRVGKVILSRLGSRDTLA